MAVTEITRGSYGSISRETIFCNSVTREQATASASTVWTRAGADDVDRKAKARDVTNVGNSLPGQHLPEIKLRVRLVVGQLRIAVQMAADLDHPIEHAGVDFDRAGNRATVGHDRSLRL
ncbi:hypothetical protein NKH55_30430 [Mesorhizobium opportunistum]|uniref:hypothetical protein n=1 Tax=Mesorhizobium opportunistum TaxID=593909 RepID=UPI0033355240